MRWTLLGVVLGLGACGSEAPVTADAAPDAEILAPSCSDGTKNGTETDLDCGGMCGACAVGKVCTTGGDCANGTCFAGTCGDRLWFAQSTGSNVSFPGVNAWVAAPGASVQVQLNAQSLVFMTWMGTSRFVGGGSGTCHLGQRFNVDGNTTGEVTWGDAIMVQRGATRWHEPFNLERALTLPAGTHTIAAEMTNGAGASECYLDGDAGAPYDRSYLSVVAYAPSEAWYAESTNTTGALAGPSGWTDIPGVTVDAVLTDTRLVMVTMNGTQLAQNGTTGHCAYRLVVDGTPLGDANHGQAISVGDVAGGWWAPVTIKWGVAMNQGTHTIKAQVRNSGGASGTCEAGAGNQGYAKFRLLAALAPAGGSNAYVESTGGTQLLGSVSAWTPVAGLSTMVDAGKRGRNVQVEVAGTQLTGTGSGHCAYRLVIDTPLGQPDHGQAINVGDGGNAWWTYMGLTYGAHLSPGMHSIRLEARNSSTTGDCGVNGDNLGYGRVRMFVRSL